jgi:hypothetical protein
MPCWVRQTHLCRRPLIARRPAPPLPRAPKARGLGGAPPAAARRAPPRAVAARPRLHVPPVKRPPPGAGMAATPAAPRPLLSLYLSSSISRRAALPREPRARRTRLCSHHTWIEPHPLFLRPRQACAHAPLPAALRPCPRLSDAPRLHPHSAACLCARPPGRSCVRGALPPHPLPIPAASQAERANLGRCRRLSARCQPTALPPAAHQP